MASHILCSQFWKIFTANHKLHRNHQLWRFVPTDWSDFHNCFSHFFFSLKLLTGLIANRKFTINVKMVSELMANLMRERKRGRWRKRNIHERWRRHRQRGCHGTWRDWRQCSFPKRFHQLVQRFSFFCQAVLWEGFGFFL